MAEDTIPTEEKPAEAQIEIRVVSQDGAEVRFKLKKTTPLQKVFDAFCKQQDLKVENCRFMLDGSRLKGTQTPQDLDLEDNDMIDMVREQIGGFLY